MYCPDFKGIRKAGKTKRQASSKAKNNRARQSMGGQFVDTNSDNSAQTQTSQVYLAGARPQLMPFGHPSNTQDGDQYPSDAQQMC